MSKGDRKLSIVDVGEIEAGEKALQSIFDKYASSTKGMTQADLAEMSSELGFMDKKYTSKTVGTVFAKVKLSKKKAIKFMQFKDAWRNISVERGVTYHDLIKLAQGTEGDEVSKDVSSFACKTER
jgi:hypothetical protein